MNNINIKMYIVSYILNLNSKNRLDVGTIIILWVSLHKPTSNICYF